MPGRTLSLLVSLISATAPTAHLFEALQQPQGCEYIADHPEEIDVLMRLLAEDVTNIPLKPLIDCLGIFFHVPLFTATFQHLVRTSFGGFSPEYQFPFVYTFKRYASLLSQLDDWSLFEAALLVDPDQSQIRALLLEVVLEEAICAQNAEIFRRALLKGAQLSSVRSSTLQMHAAFISAELSSCAICLYPQTPDSAVSSCANGHSCHFACLQSVLLFSGVPACPECRAHCFDDRLAGLHFTSPGESRNLLMLAVNFYVASNDVVNLRRLAEMLVQDFSATFVHAEYVTFHRNVLRKIFNNLPNAITTDVMFNFMRVETAIATDEKLVELASFCAEVHAQLDTAEGELLLAALVHGKPAFAEFLVARGVQLAGGAWRMYADFSAVIRFLADFQPALVRRKANWVFFVTAVQAVAGSGDLKTLKFLDDTGGVFELKNIFNSAPSRRYPDQVHEFLRRAEVLDERKLRRVKTRRKRRQIDVAVRFISGRVIELTVDPDTTVGELRSMLPLVRVNAQWTIDSARLYNSDTLASYMRPGAVITEVVSGF